MTKFETWEEIEKKYPDSWVAILKPKVSDESEFLGGEVFYHSKDKNQLIEKTKELGDIEISFRWTGDIPHLVGLSTIEFRDAQA